ncbi:MULTISPECIES: RNA polymerase sigma factor [unclassified Carboxylicivirga]|uniref:RNA polymerase sigma factor n=1 Tax=Carboxylicivirga TaxID=1628153 RepID=UPI003D3324ED
MKIANVLIEYNSETFKKIFSDLFPSMCALAGRILKDDDKGKDIAQESFVKLWKNSEEEFSDENALRAYLYVLVKNACISQIRKDKRKLSASIDDQYHLPLEDHFIDEILREETYRLLKVAIDQLSPQARKVVRLALKGYSNQEIANELNVTLNTIKTVKKRAYKFLREKLGHQFVLILLTQLVKFF